MRCGNGEGLETSSTGDVDVSGIARALWRKRWWIVAPTLAALVGAGVLVNVMKPRYTADARLLLENQESFLTRADKGERPDSAAPDAEAVQSQIQLLTSRDLARRVIKSLELAGNPEYDPLAKGIGPLSRVLILLGVTRDPTRLSPEDRILESFFERYNVLSPTKTRVLSIEFSSRNPDLAARGANAVADSYIELQQDAKRENARAAARSLATLVADLQNRVVEAEARAEDFRIKSGLLVGTNNATITTQQLGDLNTQLSASRAAQADAQAKARVLREMLRLNRVGDIPDVANNEFIRRISEQRVALRAQLALESRTLLPAHPRIKELSAQLADLDLQWRAAAERTARTLENDARIAASRVENLSRALDEQKRVAGAAGAEEVRLRELERAARLLKEQLEAETAKYQEALAREGVKATPADARVIQRALAPQLPSFPKKLPITVFATLAALVLSVGWIVAGEMLSGRARVAPAVEDEANDGFAEAETAAPAPAAASTSAVAAVRTAPSAAVGRIDAARTLAHSVKTLFASCGAGEKGAAAAVTMARALSRRGRAVLVAADPENAAFDRLLRESEGKPTGLSDLVAGSAAFAEVVHRDADSRLHVVPAGRSGGDARHDLSLVVQALAGAYDFVVFATASIDNARRLAPLFDMTLAQGEGAEAGALCAELSAAGLNVSLVGDADGAASDLFAA